ncbi:MAG: caspase family protein [Elusimicrobiota bacterium]
MTFAIAFLLAASPALADPIPAPLSGISGEAWAPRKVLRGKPDDSVTPLMRFSPKGDILLASDAYWEVGTGLRLAARGQRLKPGGRLSFSFEEGPAQYGNLAAFDRDWRRAVFCDKGCSVWDTAAQRWLLKEKPLELSESFLSPSPSGSLLVDADASVYDAESGRRVYKGRHGSFPRSAFTPDGTLLAVAENRSVILLDTVKWKPVRTIEMGYNAFTMAISPDGKSLAMAGVPMDSFVLQVFDLETGSKRLWQLCQRKTDYLHWTPPSFSPDSKQILTHCGDEHVQAWDIASGTLAQELAFPKNPVRGLAFSPDGSTLATGHADGAIILWSKEPAAEILAGKIAADPSAQKALEAERDEKLAALSIQPKGEFESTREHQERVAQAQAQQQALREEYAAKIAESKNTAEEHARQAAELRRLQSVPYRSKAELGRYDADKGGYYGSFSGKDFFAPVPRETAPGLREKAKDLVITATLRPLDSVHAGLADASLWDGVSKDRYPIALTEQASPTVQAVPGLSILSLDFSDESGDGLLDAGENAEVRVAFKNSGKGQAFGVNLELSLDFPGVDFPAKTEVGPLAPGKEKALAVRLRGQEGLRSGEARLKAVLTEADGFDSAPMLLAFKTRESFPPGLKLVGVEAQDPDGGRSLSKGKECFLTLTVRNEGKGPAADVRAEISASDPAIRFLGESSAGLGALGPGESKTASFNVAVARRYSGPALLPMTLELKERTGRFTAKPELRLALGEEPLAPTVVRVPSKEAAAPEPAAGVESPPELPPSAKPFGDKDFAVVMGIERYRNVPKSDYSYDDAKLVKGYLLALGLPERNIETLTDDGATFTGIKKSLETWLANRVKAGGRVFVYYSGHGAPDSGSGAAYLLPHDGDPNYLADTAYPLGRLYASLGRLPAKEVLVVLDSCFSGAGGRSVLAKGARPLVLLKQETGLPSNMAVLSASDASQTSNSSPEKRHGLLTYHFLEAVRSGSKDLAEAYARLKPRVEDEAKAVHNASQTPALMHAGGLEGRFLLRR